MNLTAQRFMKIYEETQADYWLAAVALSCLNRDEPIPDIAQKYVKSLLREMIEKKSGQKSKAGTFKRHEEYLGMMRELIFLTGTTPEDAAERIVYTSKHGGSVKYPSVESLLNWWYNRPARLKTPMTIEDLGFFDSKIADQYEQFDSNFSAEITGKSLRVRQEIRDQIPERHPMLEAVEEFEKKQLREQQESEK